MRTCVTDPDTVLIVCCRVWTTGRRCLLFWKEKHSACLKTEKLLHRYEHFQNIAILLFRYSAILGDVYFSLVQFRLWTSL